MLKMRKDGDSMINDEDILQTEKEPAKIVEPSHAERQERITRRVLDLDGFVAGFKQDFIDLAVHYYPALTKAQSVKTALEQINKDLQDLIDFKKSNENSSET